MICIFKDDPKVHTASTADNDGTHQDTPQDNGTSGPAMDILTQADVPAPDDGDPPDHVHTPNRVHPHKAGAAFPLLLASEGERVRIVGFAGGHQLIRRMTDLGLPLGSELAIIHRQGRGAVVVAKNELRIGLGAGMAHKVLVTAVPHRAQ